MKTRILVLVLFGLLLAVPFAFAAQNYQSMTTEELCKSYPSAMQSPAEKQAFQQEWSKRMQSMTPQERQTMYQREAQKQRGAVTTTPAPMGQAGTKDYVTMSHEDFNKLCQNQQYMQGLTAEQRMEIDREWQRRIPYMTPEERKLYYPEGRRYYTGA
jgi:hypothetical protein